MDLKPSVLAVCFFTSPGSVADNFYTLCRALARRTRLSILTSAGFRERSIPDAQEICHLDVQKQRISSLLSPALWKNLVGFSRRERYDLVFLYHEHPLHAVVCRMATARRSLFWCLDPAPHSGSKAPIAAIYEMAKRSLLARSDRVVVACEALRRQIVQRYNISAHKVLVSFHGVLDNLTFPDILPGGSRDIDVLFFGRLARYKGLDVLLDAVRLLQTNGRQPRVMAVGPGSLPMAPAPGVTVDNRYVADRDLAELVSRSRIVVMPYRDATGSQVPQTAFAYGTPVVASAVGCLPEYVQEGVTGLLVPPGEPERLAMALKRILDDPELWDAMSRNARDCAATVFANDGLVGRLLEEVLDGQTD